MPQSQPVPSRESLAGVADALTAFLDLSGPNVPPGYEKADPFTSSSAGWHTTLTVAVLSAALRLQSAMIGSGLGPFGLEGWDAAFSCGARAGDGWPPEVDAAIDLAREAFHDLADLWGISRIGPDPSIYWIGAEVLFGEIEGAYAVPFPLIVGRDVHAQLAWSARVMAAAASRTGVVGMDETVKVSPLAELVVDLDASTVRWQGVVHRVGDAAAAFADALARAGREWTAFAEMQSRYTVLAGANQSNLAKGLRKIFPIESKPGKGFRIAKASEL